MNKRIHIILLTSLTLLVLVVSAVQPMVARADDSTPVAPSSPAADTSAPAAVATQPPAADTSVAPADTSVAPADTSVAPEDTSVAPSDTSAPETAVAPTDTSAAATTVTSTDTTVAPTDTTAAPTDTSTLVGSVPSGTSVVVLDTTGTPEPLATQAAADIVDTSDPMWCPSGSLPGDSGCTAVGINTVTKLIAALGTVNTGSQATGAGTIYFTSSYSKNDAVFDPAISSNLSGLTDLTIQGGWNGDTGLNYALSGVTTFSVPLTITNWNGDVTLNDIVISGVTKGQTPNGTGDGLTVQTTGKIKLSNVQSNNNKGSGAYLDNTAGSGNIHIKDSTFGDSTTDGNKGDGLKAYSNGNITLINVIADYNGADGAYLDNSSGDGNINVDFHESTGNYGGNSDFSGNNNYGLYANSAGAITLYKVTADANQKDDGAYLMNENGGGDINVNNSTFGERNSDVGNLGNGGNGLEAYSAGSISLDNVTADYNDYDGAYLSTSGSDSFGRSIYIDMYVVDSQGDVVFSNNPSDFNHNKDKQTSGNPSGLEAYGPGYFYLADVTASKNGGNGLTATSSDGEIDLYAAVADTNGGAGAVLNNTGNNMVYVLPSLISGNDFSNNDYDGLDVTSQGEISLGDVVADWNGQSGVSGAGAVLNNTNDGDPGIFVYTLNSSSDYFDYNYNDGLDITSNGQLGLTDVVADYNGQSGISGAGAVLNNLAGSNPWPYSVSIDTENSLNDDFSHNYNDGLDVTSISEIDLYNVVADDNGDDGAYLDNCYNPSDVCEGFTNNGITVTNSVFGDSVIGGNTWYGLEAYSNGLISLSSVTADLNINGSGAVLENDRGNTTEGITVSASTFGDSSLTNGNGADGLEAYSYGKITLTDVVADGNGSPSNWYNGAYLDNSDGTGNIEVDSSSFNGNVGYFGNGLIAYSAGDIILNDVTADSNSNLSDGLYLDNTYGSGNIEVDNTLGGEFSSNNANGLEAYSNGSANLTNVIADYNNWDGAKLGDPNYAPAIGGTVTVNGGDFSNNAGNGDAPSTYVECSGPCTPDPAGLEAYADSGISLSGVTANYNTGGDGAYLETFNAGTVTIDLSTGANVFDFNEGNGLEVIVGDCTISLTGVNADKNNADGAYLTNAASGLTGDIEVTDSTFGDSTTGGNGKNGLEAYSNGSITLTDVTADNNVKDGASLSGSGVSVDPSSFNNNGGDGLYINTTGGATVICSTANGNSGYGLDGTIGGVFTDGLTTAGNTLGGNNITGYSSLVNSVCHPSGDGTSGTALSAGGPGPLPWNVVNIPESGSQGSIIPVTGGTGVALDCTHYSGTDLVLPDGDQVLLPCPIGSTPGMSGSLRGLSNSSLPSPLDNKFTFVSAFDAEVTPSLTGGMMTVSFQIPSGKQGSNFTILYWDGSKWVNLGGSATPPGYFSASTNLTGDFVLVTQ